MTYKDELSTERLSDFSGIVGDFTGQQGRIAYWAQEGRVEQLKALNAQGLSASQIARRMGDVTRNAVIGKLHRLGISNGARAMRTYAKSPKRPRAKHKGGAGNFNTELRQLRAPKLNGGPLPPEPPRPAKLFKLADMEDHQCRYVFGDPRGSHAWGYCGCEKMPGSSYCPGHHGKVYAGVPVRERSPARVYSTRVRNGAGYQTAKEVSV